MMADESALQGPPSHLANGSRGRAHILPYQPHGFTGYEPNRPASMPSTPRRLGEAPGPPRVNPNPRAGMPAAGSGTQAPAQVWRMLAEVVHLHWVMKRPLGRGLFMSSKKPSMLPPKENINGQSWRRLRDPFEQNSPCKQSNTSTTSYNKNKPVSPPT